MIHARRDAFFVRFWAQSGQGLVQCEYLLLTQSGHLRLSILLPFRSPEPLPCRFLNVRAAMRRDALLMKIRNKVRIARQTRFSVLSIATAFAVHSTPMIATMRDPAS